MVGAERNQRRAVALALLLSILIKLHTHVCCSRLFSVWTRVPVCVLARGALCVHVPMVVCRSFCMVECIHVSENLNVFLCG